MKKIITLLIVICILLSSFSTMASSTMTYCVEIKIYDANGNQLSLEQTAFHVEVGDKSINGGDIDYRKHGYGFVGVLDAQIKNNTLIISTTNAEDIKLIIFSDLGGYHYHIEDAIPHEDLIENGTIQLSYNLSDLNKMTLSTSLDGDTSGEYKYYLYKIDEEKKARSDEISGGWGLFDNPESKTIYISDGTYNITYVNINQTTHTVYKQDGILAADGVRIEANQKSEEFNKHIMNISSIYDDYPYYCIKTYLSNGENLEMWNSRDNSNKIELYLHKDISSGGRYLYLSNAIADRYRRSVTTSFNGETTLADKYHYTSMSASKHKDGTFGTRMYMKDDNGNGLSFINIGRPDDVYIEVYDKDTNDLLFEDGFSSYWDHIDYQLDINKPYIAKVYSKTDKNVNATTYFDLTFQNDGAPLYKPLDIVYDNELKDIFCIPVVQEENMRVFLQFNNRTGDMQPYSFYKKLDTKTLVDTVRVAPYQRAFQEISISSEELLAYPHLSIIVERNDIFIGEKSLIDLIAKDVKEHWASNEIIELMVKGIIFNREVGAYEPDEFITRGEFTAFLSNALSLEVGDITFNLSDVDENHELYEYIEKAYSNGLISGYTDGTFKADNNIHRQNVAMIIGNAFKLKGVEVDNEDNCKNYSDYEMVDSYALNALNMCVTNGIITGKPGNKLDPKENLTRAEAAVVIVRVLNILDKNLNAIDSE